MNSPFRTRASFAQNLAITATAAALLPACSPTTTEGVLPASTAIVERYETVQSLAAHDTVVVGGTQTGVVVVSKNSGKDWQRIPVSATASFIDAAFCPNGDAVLLDAYRHVWVSRGDYTQWVPSEFKKPGSPVALTCAESGIWVAGSGSVLAHSSDGGKTWRETSFDEDAQFTAIRFSSPSVGLALGEFGMVAKTIDGGQSWKRLSAIPGDFYTYDVLPLDERTAFVSGIAGQVLKTTDGGQSWTRTENTTGAALYKLANVQGEVWAAGANGVIAQWQGNRWKSIVYPNAAMSFLGALAPVPESRSLTIGGPGGRLFNVSITEANPS